MAGQPSDTESQMHLESPVRVVAEELRRRPGPTPPEHLGRLGATFGFGLGFAGSLIYIGCWLIFQLSVRASGATAKALMPVTATWVTSLAVFVIFGTVGSIIFGSALGALNGAFQTRTWRSQSPVLAWTFGTVLALVFTLLLRVILDSRGFDAGLGDQIRFIAIPSMLFVIEGGLSGLLTNVIGRLQQPRRVIS